MGCCATVELGCMELDVADRSSELVRPRRLPELANDRRLHNAPREGARVQAVGVMACDDEGIPPREQIESISDDAGPEEAYDTGSWRVES